MEEQKSNQPETTQECKIEKKIEFSFDINQAGVCPKCQKNINCCWIDEKYTSKLFCDNPNHIGSKRYLVGGRISIDSAHMCPTNVKKIFHKSCAQAVQSASEEKRWRHVDTL